MTRRADLQKPPSDTATLVEAWLEKLFREGERACSESLAKPATGCSQFWHAAKVRANPGRRLESK
jgi:hypothetical protein